MRVIWLLVFVLPVCAAADRAATDASVQAVNSNIQQTNAELQTLNNSVNALNSSVQALSNEARNYYGGLEYVLLAIVQAFYFGLGLGLFYIFDRGRLARDIW